MQKEGFSDAIIDRFFKPFLGGIFFDNDLKVTSRLFEFVMRMLASGENSLPANGIGAISEQMAAALPAGTIKTGGHFARIQRAHKHHGSLPCQVGQTPNAICHRNCGKV